MKKQTLTEQLGVGRIYHDVRAGHPETRLMSFNCATTFNDAMNKAVVLANHYNATSVTIKERSQLRPTWHHNSTLKIVAKFDWIKKGRYALNTMPPVPTDLNAIHGYRVTAIVAK